MVEDRFLLHASDEKDWRLRHENHPLDPGWEVGQYCCCHKGVRACIEVGARVFDVVVKDGKGVIRSAFIISGAKGEGKSCVLYFDDFYFAVGNDPMELPGPYIQYRQMKMSTWTKKYGSHQLWENVTEQYAKYRKGQKPSSIDEASWDQMVVRASKIRKAKDYARNSSSCRSECKQYHS